VTYARLLASLTIRVLHLVPRPVLVALAKAALRRAEAFLESRTTDDAAREIEVSSFAAVYRILNGLA
jgi:hypothetical protein